MVDTKELLQHVLDAFNDPAFVIGVDDYKIKLANKKFSEVYGKTVSGKPVGKNYEKISINLANFVLIRFLLMGKTGRQGFFIQLIRAM